MTRKTASLLALFAGALGAAIGAPDAAVAGVAASTTFPWTVTIVGGPYDGEVGAGSFSYNPDAVVVGDEVLDPVFGSLTLEMTILGQTFTEADDVDFFDFPELTFEDFEPIMIDFLVAEEGDNPVAIDAPGVVGIVMFSELFPNTSGGYDSFATVVPEPAALLVLLPAAAALSVRRDANRR